MAAQNPDFDSVRVEDQADLETSEKSLNIEFFPGKVKRKDEEGKTVWEKTGNIYWMYSRWINGKRERVTPTDKHPHVNGITKVENCPNKHRVREYLSRFTQTSASDDADGTRDDSVFSGRKGIPSKLYDVSAEWGSGISNQLGRSMVGD